jgi:hypothetical protein
MTDKFTSDATPVEPPEGEDQGHSGSRWEPTDPTVDQADVTDAAGEESPAAAGAAPYVSVPLDYEPTTAPEASKPRSGRRRLVGIGAAAAAAGLLVGGIGGFAVGLANGHDDRGGDVAFEHHGFGDHDDDRGGFPPPGAPGDQEQAPSTGGDDGSET